MKRKQPVNRPPAVAPDAHKRSDIISQVRDYQLITPLFGGGANTGAADELIRVRATEVRGNLRFWWRACRGGQHKTIAAMKDAEDSIWGAANKAEKKDKTLKEDEPPKTEKASVCIEVLNTSQTTELVEPFPIRSVKNARTGIVEEKSVYNPKTNIPPYAAFPLQYTEAEIANSNRPQKKVLEGVKFQLTISFDEAYKDDVEAALWAWETFGGIGARTRRGFGALRLLELDGVENSEVPEANIAEEWIKEKLSTHLQEGVPPEGVPYIRVTSFYISSTKANATLVWKDLIDVLHDFRQKKEDSSRRSVWPEANAIRARKNNSQQGTPPVLDKFPKAVLGLPLIYHFVNERLEDHTLKGKEEKFERLASPIILRPLQCKDKQAVGIVLLLEGPHAPPGGVVLVEKGSKKSTSTVNTDLIREEAQKITVLNGEKDVLKAFMKYRKGNS